MVVLLVVVGALVALSGVGVSVFRRPLPWLDGQTAQPVVWGIGYALLGVCVMLMGVSRGDHAQGFWLYAPLLLLVAGLPLVVAGSRGVPVRKRG